MTVDEAGDAVTVGSAPWADSLRRFVSWWAAAQTMFLAVAGIGMGAGMIGGGGFTGGIILWLFAGACAGIAVWVRP